MFSFFKANKEEPKKEEKKLSYDGYSTNNQYSEFPPMMKDGRSIVSSWQPESHINKEIKKQNNIKSNWEYRQYLTKNAHNIMNKEFAESANDTGYNMKSGQKPNIQSNEVTGFSNYPYSFKSVLDETKPTGYVESDLKTQYLTREQLQSRQISPVITQDELLRR